MKIHALVIFLLCASLTCFCDQPRFVTKAFSSNDEYILKHGENKDSSQVWELRKKESTNLLYTIEGEHIGSQTILVSDDGRFISTIDDYSCRYSTNALAVLSFYTDGELVKSYSLEDLLEEVDNVSHSASHFGWVHHNRSDFRIDKLSLSIKTYEGTAYTFNLEDGSIQRKVLEPLRAKGALYVYGDIQKLNGNHYEMDIWHRVWGEIPDTQKIVFEVDPKAITASNRKYVFEKGGVISCVLSGGKLIYTSDILFNECNIINRD